MNLASQAGRAGGYGRLKTKLLALVSHDNAADSYIQGSQQSEKSRNESMITLYEEVRRAGGLKGSKGQKSQERKRPDGLRGNLVSPDDYLPTTRKYLDKCGWDAKVGVIAKAMRADRVPVGLWLNPCLNYLTGSDYEISNNLPEGFPIPIKVVNGRRVVIRPEKKAGVDPSLR